MSDEQEKTQGEPKLPLTKDSPIAWAEFLIDNEKLKEYYTSKGIHCMDCCAAEAETFAEGAKVHEGGPFGGFDAEKVVEELNELGKEHPFDPKKHVPKSFVRKLVDMFF